MIIPFYLCCRLWCIDGYGYELHGQDYAYFGGAVSNDADPSNFWFFSGCGTGFRAGDSRSLCGFSGFLLLLSGTLFRIYLQFGFNVQCMLLARLDSVYVMGSRYISSVGGDASRPLWLNLALVQLNMR